MTWFTEHRLNWISESLEVYGFINRVHLVRKFGISIPQAAIDLREFQEANPGRMHYDANRKKYRATFGPFNDKG